MFGVIDQTNILHFCLACHEVGDADIFVFLDFEFHSAYTCITNKTLSSFQQKLHSGLFDF